MIVLNSVAKSFHTSRETLHILRNITLELAAGTICTINGESGCGKTTLISLISGLDTVENGNITVFNHHVNSMSEEELSKYRNTVIGIVFQFHFLLEDFTAEENLMLPALMHGKTRSHAREQAMELLQVVNMEHRKEHIPGQLSGGERQRVAVARALINDPEVLLADEPTGNLDEINSAAIAELLIDITRRYNKTLLVVTHDNSLACRGDLRFELKGGVLHQQ